MEEMLDKPLFAFYTHPEAREELLETLGKSGSVSDYEVMFVSREGKEVPCSLSVRLVADEHGTPTKIAGTIRDITERRRAEEMQREKEIRLASVDTLRRALVTLSHHINNAMAAISGNAQLCGMGSTSADQLIEVCLLQTKRISAVLGALDKMVEEMDLRTSDYAGLQDAMFDIEDELKQSIGEL